VPLTAENAELKWRFVRLEAKLGSVPRDRPIRAKAQFAIQFGERFTRATA
jgi:hypothetical protein